MKEVFREDRGSVAVMGMEIGVKLEIELCCDGHLKLEEREDERREVDDFGVGASSSSLLGSVRSW